MRGFITPDRHQITFMPPSIDEWLPQEHLARFVVDIVGQLDLKEIYDEYGPSGSTPYDPEMLLGLLFYGYATGVFSSRKIEQATFDSVAFRFISGDHHPDHDTIATFRKRFLPQIQKFFVEILIVAKAMGLVKVGKVNIDGTKVQANASRHKAMSYRYMNALEKQLTEEVALLLKLAQEADQQDEPEFHIPEELKRREDRLKKIREAKKALDERAKERYKEERVEYDTKMKAREEKQKATGKKARGKPPKPPQERVRPKDQYNFTDPESRIMKGSKGFEQCYNAQAAVNEDMVILGAYANSHANDKKELIPTLDSIPEELGKTKTVAADTGYYSEENSNECEAREIDAFLSVGRQAHNQPLEERLSQWDEIEQEAASVKENMKNKLKTKKGKQIYRLRKMTVEPVFGIIKEIMGFRRFSLRGEEQINGEWALVCGAYNLKRLFVMANA